MNWDHPSSKISFCGRTASSVELCPTKYEWSFYVASSMHKQSNDLQ